MEDITENFGTLYHPKSALVFYQSKGTTADTYVEYFEMDKQGIPINAHPLTIREANQLARALKTAKQQKEPCLKPEGIIGNHVLHLDAVKGRAVWFTKTMRRELYFTEDLGIAKGWAYVPPMLWVADRNSLSVFALGSNRRPTEKTRLFNAPFFNVYENGNVCMGNVDVRIKKAASLEAFTSDWEKYFFNSYFSHLMEAYNPVKGNCVMLWESLVNTNEPFPKEVLKKSKINLKDLLR
ncbi:PRTRC system protein B [Pedobacter insulae]|uniref:PRTRC system protein B n=1 Tax=Pedobacter insulae TaxID=414048 RepID=A0A1I2ZIA8_9SPHI|nr:PRTRC system protein B [Pedobacter insulae]SFH37385.1 PRTRC system protein B [Pedobacter insulae]